MSDHSRIIYTLGAFVLGIWLDSLIRSRFQNGESERRDRQQPKNISRFSKINELDKLKKSLSEITHSLGTRSGDIKAGIEGCIGNTPLIKIKSLSDATGCEILAKAEVNLIHDVRRIVR